jgi:peroxiredoxin
VASDSRARSALASSGLAQRVERWLGDANGRSDVIVESVNQGKATMKATLWHKTTVAGSVLLLATTALLARQNTHLKASLALALESRNRAEEPRLGVRLPPLAGYDAEGRAVRMDYKGRHGTMLLVFTPSCPICAQTWTTWRQLIPYAGDRATKVYAIDLSASVSPSFASEHAPGVPFMSVTLDTLAMAAYRFSLVPRTMVVDEEGILKGVWSGALDETAVKEITNAITAMNRR